MITAQMNQLSKEIAYMVKATWIDTHPTYTGFVNLLKDMDEYTIYETISKDSVENIFVGYDTKHNADETIATYPNLIPVLTLVETLINEYPELQTYISQYVKKLLDHLDVMIKNNYKVEEDEVKVAVVAFLYLNKNTILSELQ